MRRDEDIFQNINKHVKNLERHFNKTLGYTYVHLNNQLDDHCLVVRVSNLPTLESLKLLLKQSGKRENDFSFLMTKYFHDSNLSLMCKMRKRKIHIYAEMSPAIYTETRQKLQNNEHKKGRTRFDQHSLF